MCWRCLSPLDGRPRLSRRSFTTGALSAAVAQSIDPGCFPAARDDLVEPRMSMVVPPGTPRTVALTLDACSGAADMRIIDTLLALSIPATIFVTGLWLRSNGATLDDAAGAARPVHICRTTANCICRPSWEPAASTACRSPERWMRSAGRWNAARMRLPPPEPPRPSWYRAAAAIYSPAAITAIEAMDVRIAGYSLDRG